MLKEKLAALANWEAEAIQAVVQQTAETLELGMGKVGMPLRVAVSGSGQSPSIDITLALLGQQRALARIDQALAYVAARAEQAR
jgi:glutamyl-tRNA synthetase